MAPVAAVAGAARTLGVGAAVARHGSQVNLDGLAADHEHGEALMRRRKAWYYEREPRPGVTVIGDRLLELAFGGRG